MDLREGTQSYLLFTDTIHTLPIGTVKVLMLPADLKLSPFSWLIKCNPLWLMKCMHSNMFCTLGLRTSLLMMAEAMTDAAPIRLWERGQSKCGEGVCILHTHLKQDMIILMTATASHSPS